MPCNSVAVATARLSVSAKDIVGNEGALKALKMGLAKELNVNQDRIEVRSLSYATTITVGSMVITMTSDGRVDIQSRAMSRSELNALKPKIEAVISTVAGLVVQSKTVAKLKKMATMAGSSIEETRLPGGQIQIAFEL